MAEKKPAPRRQRKLDFTSPRIADNMPEKRKKEPRPTLEEVEKALAQLPLDQQEKVLSTLQARIFRRRSHAKD